MKTLREVSKMVKITRRTLQEYNRIGLVKPSAKTEHDYWLYDDAAIQKLMLIRIYAEAGYTRAEIRQLLDSPMGSVQGELDSIIKTLEEKRKRIDGMISVIRMLQQVGNLPEDALKFMEDVDMAQAYWEKSFSESLDEMINMLAEYDASDREDINSWSYFWYNLVSIGHSIGMPADSEAVQRVVRELYRSMEKLPYDEAEELVLPEDAEAGLTEEENIEIFCEIMRELMEDQELRGQIEKQCGSGGVKQILKAIEVFQEKQLMK